MLYLKWITPDYTQLEWLLSGRYYKLTSSPTEYSSVDFEHITPCAQQCPRIAFAQLPVADSVLPVCRGGGAARVAAAAVLGAAEGRVWESRVVFAVGASSTEPLHTAAAADLLLSAHAALHAGQRRVVRHRLLRQQVKHRHSIYCAIISY